MKKMFVIIVSAALALAAAPTWAALSDPYEIMSRYFDAIGGLDKVKAQKTGHVEGTIALEGTGLEGTFVEWSEAPIKSRQNVDLTILKQTSGDNGENAWTVDPNGKLQVHRDERSVNDRQVKLLMAQYEHLNRDSKSFTLTLEKIDTAAGAACYVVRITNTINQDTIHQYIDTASYRLLKTAVKTPNSETRTTFSDYRDVNGVLVSFAQDALMLPTGMKQVVRLTRVESNIPVDATLFEPPTEDVTDFRFVNGRSAENIPFRFIEDHIYLPVTINGKEWVWLLDTGASMSVLDSSIAVEMGIKAEGSMTGQGAGNLVQVAFADLPPFSLQGLEFQKQKVAVIPINWLLRKWVGFEVAGILGYDFLSRVVTKVDYANQMISFYLPDSFVYVGTGTALNAPVADNGFHLPLVVDGQYGGLWNLDLGAGGMSFHYPYAKDHKLLDLPGVDRLGFGAGGSSPTRDVYFKTIEFAGFTQAMPIVQVPRELSTGAFASGALTGNIGNTLLRHLVLFLDYKHEKVIVEKGKDFDRVFPRDGSGLQTAATDDGRIEVVYVAPKTPGEKAGMKSGDIITAVNGLETKYLGGILAIKAMMREKPGTAYTLGLLRQEKPLTIKLVLKNLFE